MNYNFYFKTEKDASYFINQALEIAKAYGSVRLSDLHDIRGGLADYTYNKIGWAASSIINRVYTKIDSVLERYIVTFPEPDFNENNPNKKEPTTSPEPLSITICMDVLEDPWTVVHEVYDLAKKIKDRPVFITIF